MISYFDKGAKASKLNLPASLCRLEGEDRAEWMRGYHFAKKYPPQTKIVDVESISEDFALKHFKNEE